jgi:hypothetical protein
MIAGKLEIDRAWKTYAALHRWRRRRGHLWIWLTAFGVVARVLYRVPERSLRSIYREDFWQCLRTRHDPVVAMSTRLGVHLTITCTDWSASWRNAITR